MADRVLRGSRMGAVSYETDRDHDLAPRQMVKYRRISGENPRSEWERASGGAGAQRYDVAEAAGW